MYGNQKFYEILKQTLDTHVKKIVHTRYQSCKYFSLPSMMFNICTVHVGHPVFLLDMLFALLLLSSLSTHSLLRFFISLGYMQKAFKMNAYAEADLGLPLRHQRWSSLRL